MNSESKTTPTNLSMHTLSETRVHGLLSATLRDHQKAKGISQEELRRAVGLSRQTMTNVFKGTEDFKVSTLAGVAEKLGLEIALVRKSDGQVVTGDAVPVFEPRWMVFNAATPVSSGIALREALSLLTPERLRAGWAGVSVLNKDTMPGLMDESRSPAPAEALSLASILPGRDSAQPGSGAPTHSSETAPA